jgi:uncharacterized protein
MEPIVFKTQNENCYLYSPKGKSLIPIPNSLYNEILIKGNSNDHVWETFKKRGYLNPYYEKFDGIIDDFYIKNSLKHLSQIIFETTTSCNLSCEYC